MLSDHQVERSTLPASFNVLLVKLETAILNRNAASFHFLLESNPLLKAWLSGSAVDFENHSLSSFTISRDELIDWFIIILHSQSPLIISKFWENNRHLYNIIHGLNPQENSLLLFLVFDSDPLGSSSFIKDYLGHINDTKFLSTILCDL